MKKKVFYLALSIFIPILLFGIYITCFYRELTHAHYSILVDQEGKTIIPSDSADSVNMPDFLKEYYRNNIDKEIYNRVLKKDAVKRFFYDHLLKKRLTYSDKVDILYKHMYFGNGVSGVNNASRYYFNQKVEDLEQLEQLFLLYQSTDVPNESVEQEFKSYLKKLSGNKRISERDYEKFVPLLPNLVAQLHNEQSMAQSYVQVVIEELKTNLKMSESELFSMKKVSFLNGLTAFAFLFAPLAQSVNAEETGSGESVAENVYLVTDDSYVWEGAYVTDDSYVGEDTYVFDDSYVVDDTYVGGDAYVVEDAYVGEDAYVVDDTYVDEDVYVEDDVYVVDDTYVGEDVYEDVYIDVADTLTDVTTDVELDYTGTTEGSVITYFTIEDLDDIAKTHSLSVLTSGVDVEIPLSLLPNNSDVEISVQKIEYPGALGTVYDFTITANGEKISQFNTPITLTFKLDPTAVTNKANLKVAYIDENGEQKEWITPSIEEKDGVLSINANVNHFSSYGVFEVSPTTAPTGSDNGSTGTGTTTTPSTTPGTNTGSTTPTAGSQTTTTTGGATAVTSAAVATTATTSANVKTVTTSTKNELPNTGTQTYNILLLGCLLLATAGVLIFVYARRGLVIK